MSDFWTQLAGAATQVSGPVVRPRLPGRFEPLPSTWEEEGGATLLGRADTPTPVGEPEQVPERAQNASQGFPLPGTEEALAQVQPDPSVRPAITAPAPTSRPPTPAQSRPSGGESAGADATPPLSGETGTASRERQPSAQPWPQPEAVRTVVDATVAATPRAPTPPGAAADDQPAATSPDMTARTFAAPSPQGWPGEEEEADDPPSVRLNPSPPSMGPEPAVRPWQANARNLGERARSEEAVIKVTIGRVEVRAAQPQGPATPPPRPRFQPSLTLDDYLERRRGGSS